MESKDQICQSWWQNARFTVEQIENASSFKELFLLYYKDIFIF